MHDAVSVTANHRLSLLGFLDLSEIGGSEYEDSANVGMTDLVASRQWVLENIANFGGDPDAVMIYGQSSGSTSRKARRSTQYYFTWQSPMLEDAGAWHTAELAFCFDNTKPCERGTGNNTPEAQALAKKWPPPG